MPPYEQIERDIQTIIDDPKEREQTLKRIEEDKLLAELREHDHKQQMKERRKFAYQYERVIFEIFDTKPGVIKEEILDGIRKNYDVDLVEARKIFDIWKNEGLITKSLKPRIWEIAEVLINPMYRVTEFDWTRNDWLRFNRKRIDD